MTNEVKIYSKKPVRVEAIQLEGTVESCNTVLAWIGSHNGHARRYHDRKPESGLIIYDYAKDGEWQVLPGDFVLRNERGEFEVQGPTNFNQLFELQEPLPPSLEAFDHIPPIATSD